MTESLPDTQEKPALNPASAGPPHAAGGSGHGESPAAASVGWSADTHVGRVRKNNEDSFLALQFDAREVTYLGKFGQASLAGCDCVFAVSDGMGGAKSGEFASRIAVEKITRLLPKSFRFGAQGMESGFADILTELFARVHEAMSRLADSYAECEGMGATLTLCWITPGWLYFAHVGDSRIYYIPVTGEMRQITQDDSHVGWLRKEGKINEREARSHPRRNVLNKALGAGHMFVEPQVGAVRYEKGDRFLLCTDGVTGGIWDHALEDLARGQITDTGGLDQSLARKIVHTAVEECGRDNATALIFEMR
jgi:protein phosphatase